MFFEQPTDELSAIVQLHPLARFTKLHNCNCCIFPNLYTCASNVTKQMQLWLRIGAVHNTNFSVGILLLHTDSPDAYQRDQSSTLLKQKISWRYPAASFCENVENDSFSNENKTTISNHCSSLHHLLLLLLHLLADLLHRRDWRAALEQQECWRPPEKLVEK